MKTNLTKSLKSIATKVALKIPGIGAGILTTTGLGKVVLDNTEVGSLKQGAGCLGALVAGQQVGSFVDRKVADYYYGDASDEFEEDELEDEDDEFEEDELEEEEEAEDLEDLDEEGPDVEEAPAPKKTSKPKAKAVPAPKKTSKPKAATSPKATKASKPEPEGEKLTAEVVSLPEITPEVMAAAQALFAQMEAEKAEKAEAEAEAEPETEEKTAPQTDEDESVG